MRASTAATLTAVAAILLGVWDSAQTRRHNRLSVAPYLVCEYILNATRAASTYTVTLANEGVGPAIIESVRIVLPQSLGGGTYADWGAVANMLRTRGYEVPYYWNFEGGEALGVQKDRQLITAVMERNDSDAARQKALGQIQVIVKYRSIYSDQYEARLHDEKQAP